MLAIYEEGEMYHHHHHYHAQRAWLRKSHTRYSGILHISTALDSGLTKELLPSWTSRHPVLKFINHTNTLPSTPLLARCRPILAMLLFNECTAILPLVSRLCTKIQLRKPSLDMLGIIHPHPLPLSHFPSSMFFSISRPWIICHSGIVARYRWPW